MVGSSLTSGAALTTGNNLQSPNALYTLTLTTDGDIMVQSVNAGITIWNAGVTASPAPFLEMQTDCNLVLYTSANTAKWATSTNGHGTNCHLDMQTDGNLVIYTGAGAVVWATNPGASVGTSLTSQTLTSGQYLQSRNALFRMLLTATGHLIVQSLGEAADPLHALTFTPSTIWDAGVVASPSPFLVMQVDCNLVLYSGAQVAKWATNTAGQGSGCHLDMQDNGALVVYNRSGAALWSSMTVLNTPMFILGDGPGGQVLSAPVTDVFSSKVLLDNDLSLRSDPQWSDPLLIANCRSPSVLRPAIHVGMHYNGDISCSGDFSALSHNLSLAVSLPSIPCAASVPATQKVGGPDTFQCVLTNGATVTWTDGPSIPDTPALLKARTDLIFTVINIACTFVDLDIYCPATGFDSTSLNNLAAVLHHYRDLFWNAGVNHDLCYHNEPSSHGYNKQTCNDLFLYDTKQICRASGDPGRTVNVIIEGEILWFIHYNSYNKTLSYSCIAWAQAFFNIVNLSYFNGPAWAMSDLQAAWSRIDVYAQYVAAHGYQAAASDAVSSNDIVMIAMANTGSGYFERHALGELSMYQKFSEHIATGFSLTGQSGGLTVFPFWFVDDANNILFIKRNLLSGSYAIQGLSASSLWKSFFISTVLPLSASNVYDFFLPQVANLIDSMHDLHVVQKTGTASGKHEYQRYSALSAWQTQTQRTILPISNDVYTVNQAQYLLAQNRDLYYILTAQTGTGMTEIHALSASSGYQGWSVHAGTALQYVNPSNWDFLLSPKLDLYCIKKTGTSTGNTEIHRLTAATHYKQFDLEVSTPLEQTDSNWKFLFKQTVDSNF